MTTTAKVDDKQRVRIPNARPGQLVTIQTRDDETWTLTLIKEPAKERFPKGSLLKYMTAERDKEQEVIYQACVKGPE